MPEYPACRDSECVKRPSTRIAAFQLRARYLDTLLTLFGSLYWHHTRHFHETVNIAEGCLQSCFAVISSTPFQADIHHRNEPGCMQSTVSFAMSEHHVQTSGSTATPFCSCSVHTRQHHGACGIPHSAASS